MVLRERIGEGVGLQFWGEVREEGLLLMQALPVGAQPGIGVLLMKGSATRRFYGPEMTGRVKRW